MYEIIERRPDGITVWRGPAGKFDATRDEHGIAVEPYCCIYESAQEAVEVLLLAEHEGMED